MPDGIACGSCRAWRDAALALASAFGLWLGRTEV